MRRPSTRLRRPSRSTISKTRGLVVREIDPTNRRCKMVSLTEAGRAMVRTIDAITDPAPGGSGGARRQRTSERPASDFGALGVGQRRLARRNTPLQHRHRGVVPADARHRATAAGSRAAQQDPVVGGRHAPAPRGVSSGSSSSANGHDSAPWKMLPAVMPSACSRSAVVFASMHSRPAESSHQHILNRFGQNGVQ